MLLWLEILVVAVDTEETDDDRDRRDLSENTESGLEVDDPFDVNDGRRPHAATSKASGHASALATLTAGVTARGEGVGRGVGRDATVPTNVGVGGITSGSGSKKDGRLA